MNLPKSIVEANEKGLSQISEDEMQKIDKSGGRHFPDAKNGELCYEGPCSNGYRYLCYKVDSGCNYCVKTNMGC